MINWCQNQCSSEFGTECANHQWLFQNLFGLLFYFKKRKINVARYIKVHKRTSCFMCMQFYCLFLFRKPYQIEQPNLWVHMRRKKGLTISYCPYQDWPICWPWLLTECGELVLQRTNPLPASTNLQKFSLQILFSAFIAVSHIYLCLIPLLFRTLINTDKIWQL